MSRLIVYGYPTDWSFYSTNISNKGMSEEISLGKSKWKEVSIKTLENCSKFF